MRDKKGILFTVIIHGIIVVIIIIFGFTTPLPLPDEEGIMINFGTEETGSGSLEPQLSDIPEQARPESQVQDEVEEADINTQDFEEAPSLDEEQPVKEEHVEENQETVNEQVTDENNEAEEEVEPQRVVNERALYKGRNTDESSESEGITEGDGNQGSVTGSPDSDNYIQGSSSGSGGIEFSLSGRNSVNLPKPKYEVQEGGKVVVQIKVNRDGIVTYANAGFKGTDTNNQELWKAAKDAAMQARFERKPDAPLEQTGTITYYFILQ